MIGITYIIFPGGTGGNFLKDLLLLDKTPVHYTKESFEKSLDSFLKDEWMHHLVNGTKNFGIYPNVLKQYVDANKDMVSLGHYTTFLEHGNLQNGVTPMAEYWKTLDTSFPGNELSFADIDTLTKNRDFLEHQMVENIILLTCNTDISKALLDERRTCINQVNLTNIENKLNHVFPKYLMNKFPKKNILCFEFSDLCKKETYLKMLDTINKKLHFNIPLQECDPLLEIYHKNKWHTLTKFN